jgi:hypothetical protein
VATTIEFTDRLVVLTCWCGINHAVPQNLRDYQLRQHRDGRNVTSIYCPLGHEHMPAGEGEAAKLQRQLEVERERAGRLAAQRDQAQASARAHKAAATRARRRAAAGVCPCCQRTFKQLQRHMTTKHPDYDPATPEAT